MNEKFIIDGTATRCLSADGRGSMSSVIGGRWCLSITVLCARCCTVSFPPRPTTYTNGTWRAATARLDITLTSSGSSRTCRERLPGCCLELDGSVRLRESIVSKVHYVQKFPRQHVSLTRTTSSYNDLKTIALQRVSIIFSLKNPLQGTSHAHTTCERRSHLKRRLLSPPPFLAVQQIVFVHPRVQLVI